MELWQTGDLPRWTRETPSRLRLRQWSCWKRADLFPLLGTSVEDGGQPVRTGRWKDQYHTNKSQISQYLTITKSHTTTAVLSEDGGALRARIDASEAIIHDPKDPKDPVGIPRPSRLHVCCGLLFGIFGLCWSLLDLKSRWNFWDFEVQPADDPKSGTVCYRCIRQYNRYQQLQQLRTAHWKLQLTVQGIQRRRRDALRTDLQMRTPQQFAAMKCSTAASLMPSKDVLPEVGRCAIFRSRELWHEMLTPRHRLWAAWQHQICAGYLFHNSKVNTRPVHHCSIYYNRILQILQVLTLFAYRAWRKKHKIIIK